MSACAHNYVLINVSICFAERFHENLSAERFAEISAKIVRNFAENHDP